MKEMAARLLQQWIHRNLEPFSQKSIDVTFSVSETVRNPSAYRNPTEPPRSRPALPAHSPPNAPHGVVCSCLPSMKNSSFFVNSLARLARLRNNRAKQVSVIGVMLGALK